MQAFLGKIIGEFVCDNIDEYLCKDYDWGDDVSLEYHISSKEGRKTCLEYDEIKEYGDEKPIYFWHISDLKIYDKPKELSEFYTFENNIKCEHLKNYYIYPFCERTNKDRLCRDIKDCPRKRKQITIPPQSWCYVNT